ncbi:hypothetical protein BC629DRAFT_1282926, partial [Irpex lacteus]
LYEYAITLRREVTSIWNRNFRPATWLFLVNRYLTIIYSDPDDNLCAYVVLLQRVVTLLNNGITVFSALRIYAICNRSRLLFALIFTINIVSVGANIVRCAYSLSSTFLLSTQVHIDLIRGTRIAVMFGDAIVLFFTLRKTMSIRKEASLAHIKVRLTTLLIRDGTLLPV